MLREHASTVMQRLEALQAADQDAALVRACFSCKTSPADSLCLPCMCFAYCVACVPVGGTRCKVNVLDHNSELVFGVASLVNPPVYLVECPLIPRCCCCCCRVVCEFLRRGGFHRASVLLLSTFLFNVCTLHSLLLCTSLLTVVSEGMWSTQ